MTATADGLMTTALWLLHFRHSARAIGLGVAGSARWDPTGRGFATLAERVRHARADGVFLAGLSGSSGGPLIRTLRASLGARIRLIAAKPFGPVDFIFDSSRGARLPRRRQGLYISSLGLPNAHLGSRGRRFVRDFKATQPGVPSAARPSTPPPPPRSCSTPLPARTARVPRPRASSSQHA